MPKTATEASALSVKRLIVPGLHAVGGVKGLCLQVTESGARSWILRTLINGKRKSIGLGGYSDVSLAEARDQASALRKQIRDGVDPVEQRRASRIALRAKLTAMSFEKAARSWHSTKEAEYKNVKHAAQVITTLETYAFPHIGSVPVEDIQLQHVLDVLRPMWLDKTETASRLRGRIESVLAWAAVSGHRSRENPAQWKGNLDAVLAAPGRISRVVHHKALPIDDVPSFVARLKAVEGMSARALEFLILTAARSGEVRGATWDEISADGLTWVIPAKRMKAGREHRVPLVAQSRRHLEGLPRFQGSSYIFASAREGMLSDMSISAVMRRMGEQAVPHGFRSTFRDWVSEYTDFPGEIAEMALAHTISNKVEAAYRRGDVLEKRREMMRQWADFCTQLTPAN